MCHGPSVSAMSNSVVLVMLQVLGQWIGQDGASAKSGKTLGKIELRN